MQDPTRLVIWRRSVQLAADIADAIPIAAGKRAPGLRAQTLRAADSISQAIAEGCGKSSDWELARYADIAAGSVTELQTHLVLAYKHGILKRGTLKRFWRECVELRKMLHAFQRKVRERAARKDFEERLKRASAKPVIRPGP